jgi:hypothetical protein
MSNRAIWNVRQRHESLASPKKKRRISLRKRSRVGLEAALLRKREVAAAKAAAEEPAAS